MAGGIVIALLGLWVLLRTISNGNGNGNLADWLLSLGSSSSSQPSVPSSPVPPGSSPPPSTSPGQVVRPGSTVPSVGGIGRRNIP